MNGGRHELVVIGASWGGLAAIREVLRGLPPDFGAAVVIVQHRSAGSHPSAFHELLGAATPLVVTEVEDKQPLERGHVYPAPPDFHTLVGDGHLELSVDPAVGYSRPSIDVLFTTAAESYRERCVGVVLTGANGDGAAGLARVVELGGAAVVQDPETAERDEMPAAALAAVPSARVARLGEIPALLTELCSQEVHA